jgi:hypothetical protein
MQSLKPNMKTLKRNMKKDLVPDTRSSNYLSRKIEKAPLQLAGNNE